MSGQTSHGTVQKSASLSKPTKCRECKKAKPKKGLVCLPCAERLDKEAEFYGTDARQYGSRSSFDALRQKTIASKMTEHCGRENRTWELMDEWFDAEE
jgi:hypothetical protein